MKDKIFRVKRNITIQQIKEVRAKTAKQADLMADYQNDNGWVDLETSKKVSWCSQNVDLICRIEGTDE